MKTKNTPSAAAKEKTTKKKNGRKHGPFKLSRNSVQLHYDIHSWLGIICGMVFFVCVFSGSLALFEHELTPWEKPEIRSDAAGQLLDTDQLISVAHEHFGTELDLFMTLPSHGVGAEARAFGDGKVRTIFIDPADGTVIESERGTAFQFLARLHTDLHLPRPFGRYLVGFLGIFMLMSLISGIMAHPKVLKELFLFRRRPSLRLTFSDLHKQLGVWGLAFGLMMAFTGAVVGLLGLFAPVMVLSSFGGDVEKATEAFSGPHHEPTGVSAPMLAVVPLIEQIESENPGHVVSSVMVSHWGDETADLAMNLEATPHRRLVSGETHRLSLVDGTPVHTSSFIDRGIGSRLFGAVVPLHYALFGGLGLKLVYFLSGLALSFTIASGSVIWLEARRPKTTVADNSPVPYFKLGRLNLGVCLGLVVASAAAVACGRLAPAAIEPMFWGLWILVGIGSFFASSGPWAIRAGAFAVAIGLIAVAAVDLSGPASADPALRQVNIILVIFGLLAAVAGRMTRRSAEPMAMTQ